ncbi:YhbY family RNA-binding protein [Thiohalobacter sp. IOR34]|uniref:YhbY family RNA-binding protein n=1 Tax=Thiohalobacter sp. IOR34 TaxID=3057176 RepID=UPI0025B04DED|nr:YhbY family RNA-binding protein [Thiohalobacter sp. IOR34]WJW76463.1 YhbY family RNA-binding protein [Thiohalobacter sp. IOR34]
MVLTERQKRHLRGLGHRLKPVVTVGSGGLGDNVLEEIDRSIEHHELMKVRLSVGDRELRDQLIGEICERLQLTLIQRIGNIALLFRRSPNKPRIPLKL